MTAKEIIEKIIELDEKIAALRESLEKTPTDEQEKELVSRFDEMLANTKQDGMISVAMIRVIASGNVEVTSGMEMRSRSCSAMRISRSTLRG